MRHRGLACKLSEQPWLKGMRQFLLLMTPIGYLCGCQSSQTIVRWSVKTYTPIAIVRSDETATLANKRYAKDTVGQYGFNLSQIDGIGVKTLVARDQLIYLNPGRHVAEIEYFGSQGGGSQQIVFVAEPRGTYECGGQIDKEKVAIWVQSVQLHKIVSNIAVLPFGRPPWPVFIER